MDQASVARAHSKAKFAMEFNIVPMLNSANDLFDRCLLSSGVGHPHSAATGLFPEHGTRT